MARRPISVSTVSRSTTEMRVQYKHRSRKNPTVNIEPRRIPPKQDREYVNVVNLSAGFIVVRRRTVNGILLELFVEDESIVPFVEGDPLAGFVEIVLVDPMSTVFGFVSTELPRVAIVVLHVDIVVPRELTILVDIPELMCDPSVGVGGMNCDVRSSPNILTFEATMYNNPRTSRCHLNSNNLSNFPKSIVSHLRNINVFKLFTFAK